MTIGRRQFLLGSVSVVALVAALPAVADKPARYADVSSAPVKAFPWTGGEGTYVWPPTKAQLLRSFYEHRRAGVACYGSDTIGGLIDDGLAEWWNLPYFANACRLTDKGLEAARMLTGETTMSRFRQPDWLLVELTR